MAKNERSELLPGTLEMLILKTLTIAPMHGYGIARRLEQISGEELAMNEGTVYASLVRLQHRRLIKTAWATRATRLRPASARTSTPARN